MDHPRNRLAPLRNESKLRKETFENGWPADKNFLSIETFVNQGFYFLGVGNADRVQCVYCAGVLSQWEAGDDIETEHRRNFPQCPLMKKKMKNPSYRDFSTRKLSFQGWPPQKTQTPDDLAEAGLFYLGQGDKTKCFWCSGMLSEWEPNDIPIVEHAKFFPQCQWLIASKGKEFVERIQQHVQQGTPIQEYTVNVSSAQAAPTEANPSCQAVQEELLKMGFDSLVINEASKRLDSNTMNVQSLVQAILEIQSGQASGYSPNNIDVGSLARENEVLKGKTMCKICGQRHVNVVFRPCGHLVCCLECGQQIAHCPVCSSAITDQLHVYI